MTDKKTLASSLVLVWSNLVSFTITEPIKEKISKIIFAKQFPRRFIRSSAQLLGEVLEIDIGWFCAYLTDIIQNLKTQVLQLLMLVWFSGSDNTLLEPGRGLTSPLSSPKAILPPFLFLVKLQWVCAVIPCIKPSIYLLPLCSTSFFLLTPPFFCQDLFFLLLSSDHFLFPWLQESVNRRVNSLFCGFDAAS